MKIKTFMMLPILAITLAACSNTNQTTTPTDEAGAEAMQAQPAGEAMMQESTGSAMMEEETMMGDVVEVTLEDVAKHAVAGDCWMVIEGTVYNMTKFIASQEHPGGAAILKGCGTDATEIFNDRPNDSGPHSEDARAMLPDYEVGPLMEE